MDIHSAPNHLQKTAQNFVRVTTTIFGLLLLPSIALAMSTLSALEDVSVVSDRGYWFMLGSALSWPIVIVVSLFVSRIIFKEREYKAAIILSLFPCINIVVYFFGLLIRKS